MNTHIYNSSFLKITNIPMFLSRLSLGLNCIRVKRTWSFYKVILPSFSLVVSLRICAPFWYIVLTLRTPSFFQPRRDTLFTFKPKQRSARSLHPNIFSFHWFFTFARRKMLTGASECERNLSRAPGYVGFSLVRDRKEKRKLFSCAPFFRQPSRTLAIYARQQSRHTLAATPNNAPLVEFHAWQPPRVRAYGKATDKPTR